MKEKNKPETSQNKGNSRDDRLKAALKSNMAKRKAQAKARTAVKNSDSESKG